MSGKVVIVVAIAVVVLGGCKGGLRKPLPVCPGKGSVGEAVLTLGSQSEKVAPLKATGSCRLEYYVEDKRKPEKEMLKPMRLYMNPPAEIALHGEVAFDSRGVVLGANKDKFWLAIKPKISSYWLGRWSDGNDVQRLVLSPKIVLEAVGIVSVESDMVGHGDWTLSNDGPFDILTRRSADGVMIKRIYVCSCDYLVRKIEYFDEFGQAAVVAELDEYKEVAEGFSVPRRIEVLKRAAGGRDDSVRITLKSVRPMPFTDKQLEFLFQPKPRRFKHVYEVVDGKWVEQPQ